VSAGASLLLINNPGQNFTEDFTDDTGFTYDPAKAEFVGGLLRQKANSITENYNQDFASDVGFTYDSAKAEFASGVCRQKSQRPAGATFGATYTNDMNGSWGNGILTGTPNGGISISGGKLIGGVGKYLQYAGSQNVNFPQIGCFRLKLTPNYSGTPAASRHIFSVSYSSGDLSNSINLAHYATGNIFLSIYGSGGASIMTAYLGVWIPTAGTEYEFELNYDITSGATRLFLNGVQFGATQTGTGTRTSNISIFNIGAYYNGTLTGDFLYDNIEVFNAVQHTSNYTPGYSLPEYDYLESLVQCPIFIYNLYNILSFLSPTITETNAPHYVVNGYYWNGSAWVVSSDTYATSMTYAQWVANIATFPSDQLGVGVIIKVIFQNSNTLSSIDNISFNINENHYVETNIICPEIEYTG
jgi:hypothetical protein